MLIARFIVSPCLRLPWERETECARIIGAVKGHFACHADCTPDRQSQGSLTTPAAVTLTIHIFIDIWMVIKLEPSPRKQGFPQQKLVFQNPNKLDRDFAI
jgi:hypothetical protein